MTLWLRCIGLSLVAVILYAGLSYLHITGLQKSIVLSLIFLCSLLVGLFMPDLDLYTVGLKHRSIFTHSALLVLPVSLMPFPTLTAGFAMGIGIHLLADCFPKAWIGNALIKLPFFGHLGRLSFWWIFINSFICFAISIHFLRVNSLFILSVSLGVSIFIFIHYTLYLEKNIRPLLIALVVSLVLFWNQKGTQIIAWFQMHKNNTVFFQAIANKSEQYTDIAINQLIQLTVSKNK